MERALGDHEGVRVVVDVREADAVAPGAEDAEPAGARRLEQVGQEEVVARAVDLVRRDGDGHELGVARVGARLLAHRLRLGVRLQVARLRQRRHLRLGEAVDVGAVEARRRRRRHHDLAHAGGAARADHVERALVVHLEVQRARVERADRRRVVPHAVGARHKLGDGLLGADVADDVAHALVPPRRLRRRHHVEHAHLLRAALHQHLDEPRADEAGAAGHRAHRRHRRKGAARTRRLQLGEVRRALRDRGVAARGEARHQGRWRRRRWRPACERATTACVARGGNCTHLLMQQRGDTRSRELRSQT